MDDETVQVWPENWQSVEVFCAIGTQWRMDSGVRYGLDYGTIPVVLKIKQVPRKDWSGILEDIRHMEDAAIMQMRAERDNRIK